jgi:hypothetical protein
MLSPLFYTAADMVRTSDHLWMMGAGAVPPCRCQAPVTSRLEPKSVSAIR